MWCRQLSMNHQGLLWNVHCVATVVLGKQLNFKSAVIRSNRFSCLNTMEQNHITPEQGYTVLILVTQWCCAFDAWFIRGEASGFILLIISITKFSIAISYPHTYLSRNWRVVTWVSNYRYPIWTFCDWIPVIGTSIKTHFNGFLCNVLHSFQNLCKALQMFLLKSSSQDIFNSKICNRYD